MWLRAPRESRAEKSFGPTRTWAQFLRSTTKNISQGHCCFSQKGESLVYAKKIKKAFSPACHFPKSCFCTKKPSILISKAWTLDFAPCNRRHLFTCQVHAEHSRTNFLGILPSVPRPTTSLVPHLQSKRQAMSTHHAMTDGSSESQEGTRRHPVCIRGYLSLHGTLCSPHYQLALPCSPDTHQTTSILERSHIYSCLSPHVHFGVTIHKLQRKRKACNTENTEASNNLG